MNRYRTNLGSRLKYRGYVLSFERKPIPFRGFDWDFEAEDYDGPGDPRCGSARSIAECEREIDYMWEEWNESA
jgi:hypothetical protein